jgi:hypothetical protein
MMYNWRWKYICGRTKSVCLRYWKPLMWMWFTEEQVCGMKYVSLYTYEYYPHKYKHNTSCVSRRNMNWSKEFIYANNMFLNEM